MTNTLIQSVIKVSIFIVISLISQTAFGQFGIGLELRPRSEYRHGYRQLPEPGDEGILLTTQRTRLKVSYDWEDRIQSFISFQDLRVWGQYDLNTQEATVGLYEGWINFKLNELIGIKLGRQEIQYDDKKLISNSNWRLQARSHDALQIRYHAQDSTFTVDLTGAINNDRQALFNDFFGGNTYKNLGMVWINKKIDRYNMSFLLVNQGFQLPDSTINYSQTTGLFGSAHLGRVNMTASYYHQFGRDRQSRQIDAYMASFQALVALKPKLNAGLGMDMLSGTKSGLTGNQNNSFDPLYGLRHRYFGNQDLFYAGGNNIVPGLLDVYVTTVYSFDQKLKAKAVVHSFSTHRLLPDPADSDQGMKRNLGIETDLILTYKYDKNLALQLGYTQFFATESMEAIRGGDRGEIAQFIYLSLDFKPFIKI